MISGEGWILIRKLLLIIVIIIMHEIEVTVFLPDSLIKMSRKLHILVNVT